MTHAERLAACLSTLFGAHAEGEASNWIDGEMVPGTGEPISLENPATGRPLYDYRDAGAERISTAVAAAGRAQREWWRLDAAERGRRLVRSAIAIETIAEPLAELECLLSGKPIRDCRAEVGRAVEMFGYYAGWCDKRHGEVIPVPGSHLNYVRFVPYGVVGQITPWNAPVFTCAWQLAPALAAGNGVVLKPSELTPLSSVALARAVEAGGLPRGLVNIVNGAGTTTGTALCEASGVAKLVFVGSPPSGRTVAAAAARRLIPSVLELGGKSANIVFDDATLDDAVAGAQAAIFSAAGQSCVAGSRLLVQRGCFDEVVERVAAAAGDIAVGDPLDPDTRMGPLQNRRQYDKVRAMIDAALDAGATRASRDTLPASLADGEGFFVPPTVLVGVDRKQTIATEEVFGPVLVALPFDDEADAIDIANASRFGLAGAVWTTDVARAHRVAHALRAGTVWINGYKTINVMSPFGGFGESGYGRSSGRQGLDEYQLAQSVWVETAASATIAAGYGRG